MQNLDLESKFWNFQFFSVILEKNEISSKPEILTVYVPVVSMIIIFLISFSQYVEQNNNFVVFDDYFEEKNTGLQPTAVKFNDAISPNLTKTTMMSTALGQGYAGFTKY